ncbi:MAG: hypothetical protein ACL9RN_04875 [Cylindrospermopsis raciborskii]|jgi:hypothetical protein
MKPPPGQLKLFWDEVDMGNEEIIGVAMKFVKANRLTRNCFSARYPKGQE